MKKYFYLIVENSKSSEKDTLSAGALIHAYPLNFNVYHLPSFDGLYSSINDLTKYSRIYKELKIKDSSRAHKIIQDKYIIKIQSPIFIPKDMEFDFHYIQAMEHSIKGDFKKNGLTGVHYYNEKDTKIIEILESNELGVWSAIIEKLDEKSNQWIKKNNPTTFFPRDWTPEKVVAEILCADKNRVLIEDGKNNKYLSYTQSGIKVHIYTQNGITKTIYPVL